MIAIMNIMLWSLVPPHGCIPGDGRVNWMGGGADTHPVGAGPLLGWEPAGPALVESRRTPVSYPLIAEMEYLNVCTCNVEVGI